MEVRCPNCSKDNSIYDDSVQEAVCVCGWDFSTKSLRAGSLAPLGKRFLAKLIDFAIAFGPTLAVGIVTHELGMTTTLTDMLLIIGLVYLLFGDALQGGSIGKRKLGLVVVNRQTKVPCTYVKAFIRNAALFFGFIEWLFVFTKSRRRVGDMLAGTQVVVTG